MKKKIIISVTAAAVILLAVLFVPYRVDAANDGGTREYKSLTYKILAWHRVTEDHTFDKTRIYFGADRNASYEELFAREMENEYESFRAKVIEISDDVFTVEPLEGESERDSSDRIAFSVKKQIGAKVGSVVKVYYSGGIMETYPARVNAVDWSIESDLRHMKYDGEWLDLGTAEYAGESGTGDFVINEIYADCFFASPMPTFASREFKLNGVLGDEWCVGDYVFVEYKNILKYQNERFEADFTAVRESTLVLDPTVAKKPVIYLYPENKTEVSVKLELDGDLTCTYPEYNCGWQVTAYPDGTLFDSAGQSYNYLYWEGETGVEWDMSRGFCVKGSDTAKFLEKALSELGLSRREANEFIVYWLPQMQNNPYNIISFQSDVYEAAARLDITPEPDTVIRVFMVYRSSEEYVDIPAQEFDAPEREGFTVIEWGGTEMK